MENKQTAVEWLMDKLKFINKEAYAELYNESFEQAKQMEKKQIMKARDSYINQMLKVNDDLLIYGESKFKEMTSEQYYNETYGK